MTTLTTAQKIRELGMFAERFRAKAAGQPNSQIRAYMLEKAASAERIAAELKASA